jgi:NADP-dependent 3-hydroxy acid dehydrogenase YdfG
MNSKTVIITGASKGIGKSISLLLAQQKMKLVLVARGEQELQVLEKEIRKSEGESISIVADIRKEEEIQQVIDQSLAAFGKIDVLINNAGVGYFKPVEQFSSQEWDYIMDINVKGTFLMTKAVVPHMKEQKSGQIIMIASDVARRTFENGSVYCASKYAQDAFTSALRKELRKFGVRVGMVMPGITATHFDGTPVEAEFKRDWLNSNEIAKAVQYMIDAPTNVMVDEIMVHPLSQEY